MATKSAAFSPNDRVDHSTFGLGTIVSQGERLTTIAFDAAGTRKFVTELVTLTRSDVPAPPEPEKRKKAAPRSAARAR